MSVRVGINGFGRIGRNFFRSARRRSEGVEGDVAGGHQLCLATPQCLHERRGPPVLEDQDTRR